MTEPVRTTGPAFWIAYFRRQREGRRWWWQRVWARLFHPRCALCGERVETHAFSAHILDRHLGPP